MPRHLFQAPAISLLETRGPPHLMVGLKGIHFLMDFAKSAGEKAAASPATGHTAISLLETRGFLSLPYGGFCFGTT